MREEADFDKSDGGALKRLLNKHENSTAEEIRRRLQNAFASSSDWPLSRGFRMTEFLRHHAKYKDGPRHKGNGFHGRWSGSVEAGGNLTQAELTKLAKRKRREQATTTA